MPHRQRVLRCPWECLPRPDGSTCCPPISPTPPLLTAIEGIWNRLDGENACTCEEWRGNGSACTIRRALTKKLMRVGLPAEIQIIDH